ncbi:MAG: AraC family transcriptional regulator [Bacteroidota bacterium]
MNIINLPDILVENAIVESSDVIFYYHIGHEAQYRSKITFDTHCISLMITGRKQIYSSYQNFFYNNQDCLFFKSGNYLSTELSPDKKPYHSILIFFNQKALNEFKHKYQSILNSIKSAEGDGKYIRLKTDDYIENLKLVLAQKLRSNNGFSSELQRLKFEETMLYLMERHGRKLVDFFESKTNQKTIDFVKKVVEENVHHAISVEEMAFLCHMSKSTFKRTFFEIYKTAPGKWLREKRLDKSAYLLGVERKSPSLVFEEVGFASFSSFIQSFKKRFGTTPKQYQLNYK